MEFEKIDSRFFLELFRRFQNVLIAESSPNIDQIADKLILEVKKLLRDL
jgi:hypothetical protein